MYLKDNFKRVVLFTSMELFNITVTFYEYKDYFDT